MRNPHATWSEKEKALLQKLWAKGAHRNECGRQLDCSPDAAASAARTFKFKRNPRPIRWHRIKRDFKIITLVHMKVKRDEIARRLRIKRTTVDSRLQIIARRRERKAGKRENRDCSNPISDRLAQRKCLCCSVEFESTHSGNRICGPCRHTPEYQDVSAVVQFVGAY